MDGKAPIGLCGCALFEALELMLDVGIIDASGRMLRPEELRPSKLRMLGTVKGEQVFFIDRKHKIYITQEDVYRIQHAKAAVLAAVRCMFEQFDITEPADMSAVYLGGIFGGMISPKTAVNTGLLPALCEKICYGIGNAAIEGATIMLRSARARATAEHVRTYARLFNAENTADYSPYLKGKRTLCKAGIKARTALRAFGLSGGSLCRCFGLQVLMELRFFGFIGKKHIKTAFF